MDLIRNALETICQLTNTYLETIDRRGDAWVTLTSLVDHDGALNQAARDKIVMSVYNITRETTISTYQTTMASAQSQGAVSSLTVVAPPLYIDVHVMFMANFTENNYSDGLAALSRVITYFQQMMYFDQHNAPGLAPVIDKLTFEYENLSPVDVNYVMGMLGTRYLPSAFYKMRMLPFVSAAMQSRSYPVSSPGLAGTGNSAPAGGNA
jgi:hypothetical protein